MGKSLSAPTFVKDFLVQTTPLTRQQYPGVPRSGTPISGIELATGYSEFDPVVQREIRRPGHSRGVAGGDTSRWC